MVPEIYKLPDLNLAKIAAKFASNDNVSIITTNIQHFRLLQKTLLNLKTDFHSFSLPSERTLKVVIKCIPLDVTDNEMRNEFENLNFKVETVKRLPR